MGGRQRGPWVTKSSSTRHGRGARQCDLSREPSGADWGCGLDTCSSSAIPVASAGHDEELRAKVREVVEELDVLIREAAA